MTQETGIGTTADSGSSDLTAGLIGAAIAVCAWSTGTVLAKGIDMGGLAIGAYRFWLFTVVIVLFLRARGTRMTWHVVRASAWGGIALGADISLFFSAVKATTIVNATIIGALQPVLVGVVAARFFGERIRGRDALWSIVALAGVVVVVTTSTGDGIRSLRGDLLAVAAMFSWSAYFIASKRSKGHVSPTEFTAGTALWTAVIVTPLGFAFGQDMSWPTWSNWAGLAAMTVGAGVVGHVLMNWSLVRIPLWVGSTFTLLIPVFSALIAWVFLDEAVGIRQGVAMAVVIGALAVIVRGQSAEGRAERKAMKRAAAHDAAV
ncbi:DMT family transporter [Ilumatobacter sp.]|uniref:DMT family transporter n=1 Tax=Ilumatobacter sp. TaxID=1967498 RepID=UPI003B52EBBC